MKPELLDQLVEAVLYEGHILYPYRASSQKNRQRFSFGRVYPEAYSQSQNGAEPSAMQTQCLVRADAPGATVRVEVRFLHPIVREIGRLETPLSAWSDFGSEPAYRTIPVLELEGRLHQAWQEAEERRIESLPRHRPAENGARSRFRFPPGARSSPFAGPMDPSPRSSCGKANPSPASSRFPPKPWRRGAIA